MVTLILLFVACSLVYGAYTLRKWEREEDFISSLPAGDVGYYADYSEDFMKIKAIHYVLFPSVIVIIGYLYIMRNA